MRHQILKMGGGVIPEETTPIMREMFGYRVKRVHTLTFYSEMRSVCLAKAK